MEAKTYNYPFHPFKYFGPISILVFGGIAYYFFFSLSGIPSLVIGGLALYKAINETLMLIIGIIRAPESFRNEGDKLIFKLRFRKERALDIKDIMEIEEKVWLDYVHSHSIIIRMGDKYENLYLNRGLTDLKGFLEELIRVNPRCKIEGKYLKALLQREI
jgi:hypothetical protein